MKGLEGVSDSDFHGWTVPRYGADAKESGGAGVANLAVRGPRNRYMRGRENTERALGFCSYGLLTRVKKFALTHTFMKDAEARHGATVHTTRSDVLFSDRRAPSSGRRRALDIHVDHCLHR